MDRGKPAPVNTPLHTPPCSAPGQTGCYLTGNGQRVAQLGLSGPKLSKHLCDGTRLDPTCTGTETQQGQPPSQWCRSYC